MTRRTEHAPTLTAQAAIQRSDNQPVACYLFLNFRSGAKEGSPGRLAFLAWVGDLVSSEEDQWKLARGDEDAPTELLTFGLTHDGGKLVGLPSAGGALYPKEEKELVSFGKKLYGGTINIQYGHQTVHMVIMVAGRCRTELEDRIKVLEKDFDERGVKVTDRQFVARRYNVFSGAEVEVGVLGFAHGKDRREHREIAAAAFFKEYHAGSFEGYGSTMVMLKLDADTKKFDEYSLRMAAYMKEWKEANNQEREGLKEEAKALLVGRYRNGGELPVGSCPYFAHVKAMQPEGKQEVPVGVRRGVPYDDRAEGGTEGLLFVSYQASLSEQWFPLLEKGNKHKDILLQTQGGLVPNARKPERLDRTGNFEYLQKEPKIITLQYEHYFYFPSPPRLRRMGKGRVTPKAK